MGGDARQYGGDTGQTYGVPVEEIVEGIRNGVRKVYIDTDMRMTSTGAGEQARLAEGKRPEHTPKIRLRRSKGVAPLGAVTR